MNGASVSYLLHFPFPLLLLLPPSLHDHKNISVHCLCRRFKALIPLQLSALKLALCLPQRLLTRICVFFYLLFFFSLSPACSSYQGQYDASCRGSKLFLVPIIPIIPGSLPGPSLEADVLQQQRICWQEVHRLASAAWSLHHQLDSSWTPLLPEGCRRPGPSAQDHRRTTAEHLEMDTSSRH